MKNIEEYKLGTKPSLIIAGTLLINLLLVLLKAYAVELPVQLLHGVSLLTAAGIGIYVGPRLSIWVKS